MGCGCGKSNVGQRNIMRSSGRGSAYGVSGTQRPVNVNAVPTPALRQMMLKKQLAAATKKEEQERTKKIRQRSIRNKLGLR